MNAKTFGAEINSILQQIIIKKSDFNALLNRLLEIVDETDEELNQLIDSIKETTRNVSNAISKMEKMFASLEERTNEYVNSNTLLEELFIKLKQKFITIFQEYLKIYSNYEKQIRDYLITSLENMIANNQLNTYDYNVYNNQKIRQIKEINNDYYRYNQPFGQYEWYSIKYDDKWIREQINFPDSPVKMNWISLTKLEEVTDKVPLDGLGNGGSKIFDIVLYHPDRGMIYYRTNGFSENLTNYMFYQTMREYPKVDFVCCDLCNSQNFGINDMHLLPQLEKYIRRYTGTALDSTSNSNIANTIERIQMLPFLFVFKISNWIAMTNRTDSYIIQKVKSLAGRDMREPDTYLISRNRENPQTTNTDHLIEMFTSENLPTAAKTVRIDENYADFYTLLPRNDDIANSDIAGTTMLRNIYNSPDGKKNIVNNQIIKNSNIGIKKRLEDDYEKLANEKLIDNSNPDRFSYYDFNQNLVYESLQTSVRAPIIPMLSRIDNQKDQNITIPNYAITDGYQQINDKNLFIGTIKRHRTLKDRPKTNEKKKYPIETNLFDRWIPRVEYRMSKGLEYTESTSYYASITPRNTYRNHAGRLRSIMVTDLSKNLYKNTFIGFGNVSNVNSMHARIQDMSFFGFSFYKTDLYYLMTDFMLENTVEMALLPNSVILADGYKNNDKIAENAVSINNHYLANKYMQNTFYTYHEEYFPYDTWISAYDKDWYFSREYNKTDYVELDNSKVDYQMGFKRGIWRIKNIYGYKTEPWNNGESAQFPDEAILTDDQLNKEVVEFVKDYLKLNQDDAPIGTIKYLVNNNNEKRNLDNTNYRYAGSVLKISEYPEAYEIFKDTYNKESNESFDTRYYFALPTFEGKYLIGGNQSDAMEMIDQALPKNSYDIAFDSSSRSSNDAKSFTGILSQKQIDTTSKTKTLTSGIYGLGGAVLDTLEINHTSTDSETTGYDYRVDIIVKVQETVKPGIVYPEHGVPRNIEVLIDSFDAGRYISRDKQYTAVVGKLSIIKNLLVTQLGINNYNLFISNYEAQRKVNISVDDLIYSVRKSDNLFDIYIIPYDKYITNPNDQNLPDLEKEFSTTLMKMKIENNTFKSFDQSFDTAIFNIDTEINTLSKIAKNYCIPYHGTAFSLNVSDNKNSTDQNNFKTFLRSYYQYPLDY